MKMKMNYLTVTLALAMVAFAPQSSQAQGLPTVILDGNTAIGILNLPVNTVFYDVAFTFTDADTLYGPSPNFTFDFTNADDASFAMGRIIEVFDNNDAITSVGTSSTMNNPSMFIGYEDSDIQDFSIDARHGRYSDPSNTWKNEGVEFLPYGEPRYYADFTEVVPEPTTAALVLTTLGLMGLTASRRRRS
jgi:hypothetical protein